MKFPKSDYLWPFHMTFHCVCCELGQHFSPWFWVTWHVDNNNHYLFQVSSYGLRTTHISPVSIWPMATPIQDYFLVKNEKCRSFSVKTLHIPFLACNNSAIFRGSHIAMHCMHVIFFVKLAAQLKIKTARKFSESTAYILYAFFCVCMCVQVPMHPVKLKLYGKYGKCWYLYFKIIYLRHDKAFIQNCWHGEFNTLQNCLRMNVWKLLTLQWEKCGT